MPRRSLIGSRPQWFPTPFEDERFDESGEPDFSWAAGLTFDEALSEPNRLAMQLARAGVLDKNTPIRIITETPPPVRRGSNRMTPSPAPQRLAYSAPVAAPPRRNGPVITPGAPPVRDLSPGALQTDESLFDGDDFDLIKTTTEDDETVTDEFFDAWTIDSAPERVAQPAEDRQERLRRAAPILVGAALVALTAVPLALSGVLSGAEAPAAAASVATVAAPIIEEVVEEPESDEPVVDTAFEPGPWMGPLLTETVDGVVVRRGPTIDADGNTRIPSSWAAPTDEPRRIIKKKKKVWAPWGTEPIITR